jgi:aminopeptidase
MAWYPTPALAQDANMTLPAFEDFLYASCLVDWKAEHARISRYAKLLDAAEAVRIVGHETDLRLSVAGRPTDVDAGTGNMPGGEVYVCPVETATEGTIAFTEFPAVWGGRQLRGIRLRFAEGRVVDASADTEEAFLHETLDADEGARRIGELGIGCNPAIDRYMGNVYFDEKMNGTVHVALGYGFDYMGSTNESAIHWDIVKDLRSGGRIELDGEVVQENGVWAA